MSLKQISRDIQHRSEDMDRQCGNVRSLLKTQKSTLYQQASRIPLPLAMGVAFIGGFVAQRYIHKPSASFMYRMFLTYRAF